uniref:Uncharacterized protein n=1 Tax=Coccidioides posadasii RMSCC 3488 TaxID=454284 RepID=A0A0J6FE66_COCPO|nr:hypothetical protein CPAG_04914 [Coccidioides posadasii RMSCC 3488]
MPAHGLPRLRAVKDGMDGLARTGRASDFSKIPSHCSSADETSPFFITSNTVGARSIHLQTELLQTEPPQIEIT